MEKARTLKTEAALPWKGALAVVCLGAALGVLHNFVGLQSRPAYGLSWIAQDRSGDVFVLESSGGDDGVVEAPGAGQLPPMEEGVYDEVDDPLAILTETAPEASVAGADLPELPDLPRPIQLQMPVARKFQEANGALFVDSRDRAEFLDGHVPGAVNLPFDRAAGDPVALESLDSGGRPIIVYCGGGECETSINLGWMLIESGHSRVAFVRGGFPEWEASGYPVARGEAGP